MQTESTLSSRMATSPIILETTARVFHLLGKQGLGFGGHRDSIYDYENMTEAENVSRKYAENLGNPLIILKEIAQYCPVVDQHLKSPTIKVDTYLGPRSQNKIINVIGIQMI